MNIKLFLFLVATLACSTFGVFTAISGAEREYLDIPSPNERIVKELEIIFSQIRESPNAFIDPMVLPKEKVEDLVLAVAEKIKEPGDDSLGFKSRIIELLMNLIALPGDADSTAGQYVLKALLNSAFAPNQSNTALDALIQFPERSFNENEKGAILQIYRENTNNMKVIRLVGVSNVSAAIPELKIKADYFIAPEYRPEILVKDILRDHDDTDWQSALALARMGDKIAISHCINAIKYRFEANIDPIRFPILYKCEKFGRDLNYIAQTEGHKILLNWLESNEVDKMNDVPIAHIAMRLLAKSVIGCASPKIVISENELAEFRDWFKRNPEFSILR